MEIQETLQTKPCRVCGVEQPLSAYYASPNTRDKHMSTCKTCKRGEAHERYIEGARKLKVVERKQQQQEIISALREMNTTLHQLALQQQTMIALLQKDHV